MKFCPIRLVFFRYEWKKMLHFLCLFTNQHGPIKGHCSVALLSHFLKVLALSKFALLKCKIEVNPVAQILQATSTAQFQFARCWWPRESVLWGSLHFHNLKVRILKVLTLCQSAKVKQCYNSHLFLIVHLIFFRQYSNY